MLHAPRRVRCVDHLMADDQREALWAVRQNAAMPQSSKEKQEAFRARNAMLGLTEVRGLYAPPSLHAAIKKAAQKLITKRQA